MKNTDYAYAAGYIDGDGSFMLQYPGISHLTISSVNEQNIQWFHENFDGSLRVYQNKQKNRQPSFYFRFSEKGMESIKEIHPYFVEKKKESTCFQNFREVIGWHDKHYFFEELKILKYEEGLMPTSIKEELNSIKNTIEPSEEDFAYLAGFIDAEVSLDINRCNPRKGDRSPTYHPQLQCNNSKSPFFYWASARFGGQFHFIKKTPPHRNQMTWRLSHKQFDPVLQRIIPYLQSKKCIAEKIVEFRNLTLGKDRVSQRHPDFSKWYEPIALEREKIYIEVRHLNNPFKRERISPLLSMSP